MPWQDSTMWWLIALALVGLELASGTFYLLMLALGAGAAALAAQAGLPAVGQMLLAAAVGVTTVSLRHWHRSATPQRPTCTADPAIHQDIGARVQVTQWQHDTTQVHYRGATWQARHAGTGPAGPGEHEVCAIEGSCLLLKPLDQDARPAKMPQP